MAEPPGMVARANQLAEERAAEGQARDVLGREDVAATGRSLARLAEAVLEVALGAVGGGAGTGDAAREGTGGDGTGGDVTDGDSTGGNGTGGNGTGGLSLPIRKGLAIVAMGRFGGAELAYASDLDILVVFDDDQIDAEEAEEMAEDLLRLMSGETPVQRLYELDMSLRPEGRKGSLARSLKAYEGYYDRWAQVWERQALTRGRFVAGDPEVGRRFGELAQVFVWGSPLSDDDVVEIRRMKARIERERVPAGEDPEFHLKLGPARYPTSSGRSSCCKCAMASEPRAPWRPLTHLRTPGPSTPATPGCWPSRTGSARPPATASTWCEAVRETPSPLPVITSPAWPAAWARRRPTFGTSTAG